MSVLEGTQEFKEDPLLGLDEAWKNWLHPPDQRQSNSENATLKDYSSVGVSVENAELKEEKEAEFIEEKNKSINNSPLKMEEDDTNASQSKDQYKTISVKNYSSKMSKENPVDDIISIFKDNSLHHEKRQLHQEILNKVVEHTSEFKELRTLYIEYLRKAADMETFSCLKCGYETIHKSNIKTHLLLVHKRNMEYKIFKCTMCLYKVKNFTCFNKHQLAHRNNSINSYNDEDNDDYFSEKDNDDSAHKQLEKHKLSDTCRKDPKKFACDLCDNKNISKTNLKKHLMSVHKIKYDKTNLKERFKKKMTKEWLKCESCEYMTHHKKSLKNHMESHKPPEEQDRKYMCEICSKRLKTKAGLDFHMLRHKPMEEITEIFKCHQCTYQSKFKSNLKIHMEVHQAPSFVCDVCGFQSRRKWNHEMHHLTHKKETEVTIFSCALCPYKTKFKDRLKKHVARGAHLEEVKTVKKQLRRPKSKNVENARRKLVKCTLCEFETFSRKDYCKHMVKHRAQGEMVEKTYSCITCGFKTFYSSSFSTHLMSHKSLEEVQTFQCTHCSFKTRLKGNLKKHMNIHKDPAELKSFKCDVCGIQLTRKENLTVHLLLHKAPEETEILKCSLCSYQSKIRAYMQVHLKKTHKIVTRRNEYRNYCSIVNPGSGVNSVCKTENTRVKFAVTD